jgi:hypothetical protein
MFSTQIGDGPDRRKWQKSKRGINQPTFAIGECIVRSDGL